MDTAACGLPLALRLALATALAAALWLGIGAREALGQPLSRAERVEALASGRLEARVVDALASDERVPVIVVFAEPEAEALRRGARRFGPKVERAIARRRAAVLRRLAAGDFEVTRRYRSLRAVAGRVTRRGLRRLLEDERVLQVGYDGGGSGGLVESVPLVNGDAVQQLGWTGQGVTVAVLDSGVDPNHPDIGAPAVVAEQCFCSDPPPSPAGCCPNGMATMSGAGSALDDHGHGTRVTGIITSDGGVAPLGGAPDTEIVAIKVLDENNDFCCSSDIAAALDWIIANNDTLGVDVVNLSLGTAATFQGTCDDGASFLVALTDAIDTLHAQGVLSVAASMNGGLKNEMAAPACIANALAVGAVWDDALGAQSPFGCLDNPTSADLPACFSNSSVETDLYAPGALVTSTKRGGGTITGSGTSFAAPLVAGCAAQLLERDPSLTPAQLEAALETSPSWITEPMFGLSFPRLDCQAALQTSITAVPSLGPGAALALAAALLAAVGWAMRTVKAG